MKKTLFAFILLLSVLNMAANIEVTCRDTSKPNDAPIVLEFKNNGGEYTVENDKKSLTIKVEKKDTKLQKEKYDLDCKKYKLKRTKLRQKYSLGCGYFLLASIIVYKFLY